MSKKNILTMNLQTFAEGGDGAGEGNGDPEVKVPSFDDFLKGEGMQAEFDRRIQKALNTAKEKWEASKNEELTEAERLAKMTKAEKDQYNFNKRLEALEEREKAVARGELLAEAKNTLAGKNIPTELATLLDLTDAEKCNKSIETLEKAFNDAVSKAVAEKLKGSEPPKKAPSDKPDKDFKDMTYQEKLDLKIKNPALYKQLAGK